MQLWKYLNDGYNRIDISVYVLSIIFAMMRLASNDKELVRGYDVYNESNYWNKFRQEREGPWLLLCILLSFLM